MAAVPIDDGAYIIVNQRSNTVLDLENGSTADGTKVQGYQNLLGSYLSFDQLWIVRQINNSGWYSIVNARSGTYLDLHNGSSQNGTQVQGYHDSNTYRQPSASQSWQFFRSGRGYWIKNKSSQTVIDLDSGRNANGTRVQGWAQMTNDCQPNQTWFLTLRSKTSEQVREMLAANPFIKKRFRSYSTDPIYVTVPKSLIEDIWKATPLGSRRSRPQSYDSDDFAFAMRAAVGDWCYNNVRGPVAICLGIVYGKNSGGTNDYTQNWYIDHDTMNGITFFNPRFGTSGFTISFECDFGVF